MSSLLNSIFVHKEQPIDLIQMMENLQPYMLINRNNILNESKLHSILITPEISKSISHSTSENKSYNESISSSPSDCINTIIDDIVSPTQADSLFWCLYIAMFGYNDYLQIGRNYGVKELEIKKSVGDFIKANPSKLKQTNTKITKIAIQEILSELLTSPKDTSMLCLVAISVFFNINIILIDPTKRFYLEYISCKDSELQTFLLYKDNYGKYKISTEPLSVDNIIVWKESMICLENYLKPMKPISAYKVEELILLSTKIGICLQPDKKYKKAELYEQISNMISWK